MPNECRSYCVPPIGSIQVRLRGSRRSPLHRNDLVSRRRALPTDEVQVLQEYDEPKRVSARVPGLPSSDSIAPILTITCLLIEENN